MTALLSNYQNFGQTGDYEAQLRQIEQAKLAAQAQSLKEAVDEYDAQKRYAAQQALDTRQGVYQDSRLSAIGGNEVLAAKGLAGNLYMNPTSGVSETSRVRQDVSLRQSLSSIDKARYEAEAGIDRAISALKAQSKQREADIMAETAQALADYREQLRRQQEAWAQIMYERETQAQAQAAKDAAEKAKILAGYGDFSGYGDLGWDTSVMQAYYAAQQAEAAAAAASKASSSSSSSGTSGPKPTAAQYKLAVTAALGGDTGSAVVSTVEKYSGLPFSTAMAAEKALAGTAGASNAPQAKTTAGEARAQAEQTDSLAAIRNYLEAARAAYA